MPSAKTPRDGEGLPGSEVSVAVSSEGWTYMFSEKLNQSLDVFESSLEELYRGI